MRRDIDSIKPPYFDLDKMSSTLLAPLRFRSRACICRSFVYKRQITTDSPLESSSSSELIPPSEAAISEISNATKPLSKSYQDALETSLRQELIKKPANIMKSYLDPTPSHLLNLMLADLLPKPCHAPPVAYFQAESENLSRVQVQTLPQDHLLAYFPPAIPSFQLLADGTDTLHSPGPPFVRRLWAGGSLAFHHMKQFELTRMTPSTCYESIQDVKVRGRREGDEKVFVHLERCYTSDKGWRSHMASERKRKKLVDAEKSSPNWNPRRPHNWSVAETRDLVFLREKTREQALEDVQKEGKVLKSPLVPDWSTTLTPTPDVLFRWSALTYNAHRIHLDPQYCREVEGHRNLLVHGPLSLTLILASLRSQLHPGEMIRKFEYRNLAPLYVSEEMKICIKAREEKIVEKTPSYGTPTLKHLALNTDEQRIYDVWIEGPKGGIAVKGKATLGRQVDRVEYDHEQSKIKAMRREQTQESQGLAEQRKAEQEQNVSESMSDEQALLQVWKV